jgi:hypothetical protein
MRGAPLVLVLAGGGTAWMLHLLTGYFLVSLGCPRGWPALSWTLITVTGVCTASALAVAVVALRARRRADAGLEDGETSRLLSSVAALLATLFAIMIVLGGLAVAALPPCQEAVGGQ